MNFKKILQGIGIAVLAFALGTATYSQPVTTTVRSETITLIEAQLDALGSTPVQIVAAQGAHETIVPLNCVFQYKFNTTPYAIDGNPQWLYVIWGTSDTINYGQGAFIFPQIGLLDQSANTIGIGMDSAVANSILDGTADTFTTGTQTQFQNQGLYVTASQSPSGGNGTLVVTVTYIVIATAN